MCSDYFIAEYVVTSSFLLEEFVKALTMFRVQPCMRNKKLSIQNLTSNQNISDSY